jgi:hypothetical protein
VLDRVPSWPSSLLFGNRRTTRALWGMEKARFYALSSPFPLYTCSDHAPLQWISKTDKGAASAFLIERLSDLDVIHQCVAGKFMAVPDSLSCYPMLGPCRLAPRDLMHSLQELLGRMPDEIKSAATTQVYAGESTGVPSNAGAPDLDLSSTPHRPHGNRHLQPTWPSTPPVLTCLLWFWHSAPVPPSLLPCLCP